MDQYDSQPWRSHDGTPAPATPTPIYDRLLAEWREAGRSAEREAAVAPGNVRVFVPSARTT
ncbi:hypothetical protein OG909_27435 [Streptomyces sp. NBC_01754]|uniref:hypothetical protein n=1 Tax=Streptomyces sp. NBC_01754 TaxID=2975930 RepID=UPI002DD7E141|nr:hypothetical protein [Streptomyces sp. NBC_01754]WSC95724.1 hypothetical protein OG909_27435 [Streptomyces sp. NBC_01754]